jgi:hypothetical protein
VVNGAEYLFLPLPVIKYAMQRPSCLLESSYLKFALFGGALLINPLGVLLYFTTLFKRLLPKRFSGISIFRWAIMSNQELHNQNKTAETVDVQKRRQFIKGAGIATPVVFSLMNRSAFGAAQQCLSQQISGNMSHVGAGSCASGYGPAAWKSPVVGDTITKLVQTASTTTTTTPINRVVKATYAGSRPAPSGSTITLVKTVNVTTKTYQWLGTGITYGVLTTTNTILKIYIGGTGTGGTVTTEVTVLTVVSGTGTVNPGDKFTQYATWEYTGANPAKTATYTNPDAANSLPALACSDFTGGTTFSAAFGYGPTTPMRAILCANSAESSCVAALLNATFTPSINYVLTVAQVKELCATPPGTPYPANYASLDNFLASTW